MKKNLAIVFLMIVCAGVSLPGDPIHPKLPVVAKVTITRPAGGEAWRPGQEISIVYSFNQAVNKHYLRLFRGDFFVGWITANFIPYAAGQTITHPWKVGHVSADGYPEHMITAPAGDNYRIGFSLRSVNFPVLAFSGTFAIIDTAAIIKSHR